MTKQEKAIREFCGHHADWWPCTTQVQEMLALAQPEQKYHRGARLICLETEEYCVIHISGTDRQWVKFPDSHIGVYTNEQVAELFELLPKELEPEQEPEWYHGIDVYGCNRFYHKTEDRTSEFNTPLYTTPPKPKELEQEPVAWMSEDERESFERFNETCEDGEGYDVPKTMMRRLAEIGVIHHTSRGIYGITKFGRFLVGNTTPPQRKPMTDEEILSIARDHYNLYQRPEISFARAIEAAHNIFETKNDTR